MTILEQITSGVNTDTPDNPSSPLGTLSSGATILAKALSSFPGLAESAQMIATIGGGEEQPQGKYNGDVDFMGETISIKDGVGEIEGRKVYTSPNGAMVSDDKGQIIGRIENSKFVVIDESQAKQLAQSKTIERRAA